MNNVSRWSERFRSAAGHGLTVVPLDRHNNEPIDRCGRAQAMSESDLVALDASDTNVGVLCGPDTGICVLSIGT